MSISFWHLPEVAQRIPPEGLCVGSLLRRMLAIYNLTNFASENESLSGRRLVVAGHVDGAGAGRERGRGEGAGGGRSCVGGRIH